MSLHAEWGMSQLSICDTLVPLCSVSLWWLRLFSRPDATRIDWLLCIKGIVHMHNNKFIVTCYAKVKPRSRFCWPISIIWPQSTTFEIQTLFSELFSELFCLLSSCMLSLMGRNLSNSHLHWLIVQSPQTLTILYMLYLVKPFKTFLLYNIPQTQS